MRATPSITLPLIVTSIEPTRTTTSWKAPVIPCEATLAWIALCIALPALARLPNSSTSGPSLCCASSKKCFSLPVFNDLWACGRGGRRGLRTAEKAHAKPDRRTDARPDECVTSKVLRQRPSLRVVVQYRSDCCATSTNCRPNRGRAPGDAQAKRIRETDRITTPKPVLVDPAGQADRVTLREVIPLAVPLRFQWCKSLPFRFLAARPPDFPSYLEPRDPEVRFSGPTAGPAHALTPRLAGTRRRESRCVPSRVPP